MVDQAATASTEAHLELLTEHFGFNPKAWVDKLVDAANQQLYELAENVEGAVVDLLDQRSARQTTHGRLDEETKQANLLSAEKGMHKLLTLFEHRMDWMYDTFELWSLVHVFGITPRQAAFLTLDHQCGLDLRPLARPDSDGATSVALAQHYKLVREERALRVKIQHLKETGRMLDDAKASQQARKARLEQQLTQVAFLFKSLPGETRSEDVHGSVPPNVDRTDAPSEAVPKLDPSTAAKLRKVRGDAHELLRLAQTLAQMAPLTTRLAVPPATFLPVRPLSGDEVEDGVPPPPPDLGNRDAYLHWEVKRALAALPRTSEPAVAGGAGAPSASSPGADAAHAVRLDDLARRLAE